MPWGKLDDSLYDHPKLDALGRQRLPCVGLWAVAISWSNRRLTDGHIPTDRIRLLGGTHGQAEALVAAGLFDVAEDGYLIHDFTDFNDSREAVMARRAAAAHRQRQARESREQSRSESQVLSQRDKGVSHASTRDTRAPAFPARPDRIQTNEEIPPPPAERGRRKDETNPRATGSAPRQVGDNPRANGSSPRQEREAEKRAPTKLGDVLREAQRRQGSDDEPSWLREPAGAES
jgi:hypothetical protein